MVADDGERGRRVTRREALRAGGACAGGAAMLGLLGDGSGRAALDRLGRLGKAAAGGLAQNAILIVTDSTRADHLGAYGSKRGLTPNLDALARDGVTFTRAHPESMPTGPARDTLLTGDRQFPFRHWHPEPHLPRNPGWNSIPAREPTFLELLDRHGVTSAYVTDNPFLVGPRYARVRARTDHFVGFVGQTAQYAASHRAPVPAAQVQQFLPPSLRGGSGAEAALALYLAYAPRGMAEDDYFTARVFKAAIDLIDTLREHQPFVLVVDGFDPHEPWDPPRAWAARFAGPNPLDYEPLHPFDAPIGAMGDLGLPPAAAARVQGLYAAELAFTDHWIGNLLGKVASAGLTDTTAVMYTSDHGVFLGEHGLIGKSGRHLHRELHHTPLVVRHPQRKLAGKRNAYFASTNDVAPTLMSFLGVKQGSRMDGEDLTAIFDRRRAHRLARRSYMTSSYDDYVMAHDGRWLLTMRTDGSDKQLFDTRHDPRELHDVAGRNPAVVRRLLGALIHDAGGPLPRFSRTGVVG
ncbi:MAG TPA: sulfatase [Conexibacter sp.]|nr:sulfatase [Conexibacter sp.]